MTRTGLVVVPLVALLASCTGLRERIGADVDQADRQVSALVADVGHPAPGVVSKASSPVVHEEGIWIGKNTVKLAQPALPPIFQQQATFDRTVHSLSEFAERITLRSGIPTKVTPDALIVNEQQAESGARAQPPGTAPAGRPAPRSRPAPAVSTPAPSTPNGGPDSPVRISYLDGTFKGLLDTASARFGVYWKYVNGEIQFYHTDSRSFQINAIPGDSSFSAQIASGATTPGQSASPGGAGGGGGGTGGITANNSQNTAVSSELSVFAGMVRSISAMLSEYGKVVSSPATGSITVVDTPDRLDQIAAFVEAENKALSRQVVLNVTVLAVTLSDADEYGINWDLLYNNLHSRFGVRNAMAARPGSVGFSAGILQTANSKFSGTTLLINALSEQGRVRRHTTASVVTLNNQPVPVQVAKQTSYLKSSETTVTALVGTTTTLTPGTITSGFNMSVLPHILNNGTVLLQFSTDISSLRAIRTVSSNGATIETPELDTRNFLQRVAMKSNETLVISGFEQTDDNLGEQGVGTPRNMALGGGFRARSDKEVIVILITPTTLGT